MAAPTYVASSKAGTTGTSLNVAAPTGLQAGDLLVAILSCFDDYTPTDPTGGAGTAWTSLGTRSGISGMDPVKTKVVYRFAAAGDVSATFNTTTTASTTLSAVVTAYRGVHTSTPINTSASLADTNFDTATSTPTITTTVADCVIIHAAGGQWWSADAPTPTWSAGPTDRQHQSTSATNTIGYADEVKASAGVTTTRTLTYASGSDPSFATWQVALAPAPGGPINVTVNQATEADTSQAVTTAASQDVLIGQATSTELAQPVSRKKVRELVLLDESQIPQPITVKTPYNGSFAAREDLTEDYWPVPTQNLLLANTEAGEYTNGLVATVWWSWSTPQTVPVQASFSFTFSGQTASGGGALRLYSDTGEVMPVLGDLITQTVVSGASGTVTLSFAPVADTTYYLQQGIEEKAGSVSHLGLVTSWSTPPTFTPVVP